MSNNYAKLGANQSSHSGDFSFTITRTLTHADEVKYEIST